jgi:hypothetical protein
LNNLRIRRERGGKTGDYRCYEGEIKEEARP